MAEETAAAPSPAVQRLCSEIQLFDLCDLDSCRFKSSRFCTNEQLLSKFESIKEEDDRNTLLYEEDESEEDIESESDFDDPADRFDDDEDF